MKSKNEGWVGEQGEKNPQMIGMKNYKKEMRRE